MGRKKGGGKKYWSAEEKYQIINQNYEFKKAFIIDDEKSFIMSLCKFPNIIILESKYRDNLLTEKEKQKYKGNYIVINKIILRRLLV